MTGCLKRVFVAVAAFLALTTCLAGNASAQSAGSDRGTAWLRPSLNLAVADAKGLQSATLGRSLATEWGNARAGAPALLGPPPFRVVASEDDASQAANAQRGRRGGRRGGREGRGYGSDRGVAGLVLGVLGGFVVGGAAGVLIAEDSCHCDHPALRGFVIGAPIGAVIGGAIGYGLTR